jgi:hypothetical protein
MRARGPAQFADSLVSLVERAQIRRALQFAHR